MTIQSFVFNSNFKWYFRGRKFKSIFKLTNCIIYAVWFSIWPLIFQNSEGIILKGKSEEFMVKFPLPWGRRHIGSKSYAIYIGRTLRSASQLIPFCQCRWHNFLKVSVRYPIKVQKLLVFLGRQLQFKFVSLLEAKEVPKLDISWRPNQRLKQNVLVILFSSQWTQKT